MKSAMLLTAATLLTFAAPAGAQSSPAIQPAKGTQPPGWFLDNFKRYDSYDRNASKVYLGEYASRGNAWSNALAEAAYMSSLERNGDVVQLASYAPLLARIGHTQWNPDLIYFTATDVYPTVNYYVQQLYGANSGDAYIPNALSITPEPARGQAVTAATVRDSKTGDLILKLTNASASPMQLIISLQGAPATLNATATKTLLTGAPTAQNNQASPRTIMPQTSTLTVSAEFPCDLPANSFTVIRLKTK